jgi:hypothetical protein
MTEATETDQIERDLAKTRARMDNRLDELQDRLSPGSLLNDALAYFKGGDGGEFSQDLFAKLKANPLPAALTGIGLAWLMASSNRPAPVANRVTRERDLAIRLRTAESGVIRREGEHPDAHAGRIDEARGHVLGVVRNPSDTSESYGRRIKEAMASATQSVRGTAHNLSANASDAAGHVSDRAQRGGVAVQDGMGTLARSTRGTLASATSNPVALGALAAAVGVIAGSMIPTSDEEERALGATAEKLRTAGRDLAQDVVDRGARVASDAIGAVKDSAQVHGLTGDKPVGELVADLKSGSLVGAVKEVAAEAAGAGKGSVQTHFASGTGVSEDPDSPQRM